jgi:hypothetical protein
VIALPFQIRAPADAVVTAQEAVMSGPDAERVDLLADGAVNVRDLPEGARMLSITVNWGADDFWATYYWALEEPAE